MRQDQALTYGLNVWTQRELYTTENSNFLSMSGSVSKRIKCLHTKTKESVSFNNVICLTWVCVYHILSPNILKSPQKDKFIPQRHFLKWKENQNT